MDIKCDFLFQKPFLKISENRTDNFLRLDGVDYYVSYLNADFRSNKGGNSFVFTLYAAQPDNEDAIPEKVIKISKYPETYKNKKIWTKNINKNVKKGDSVKNNKIEKNNGENRDYNKDKISTGD